MNLGGFFNFDIFSVRIEIVQNDRKQVQNLQAPKIALEQHFLALMRDAAKSTIPTKITMSCLTDIYNEVTKKNIENSISFMNNIFCDKYGVNTEN